MAKDKYYGKTLRKNFARHEEVMAMPNLLEIQKKSYRWFLETGLREVFADVASITDYAGNLELSFIDYSMDEKPKYDVEECKARDATYAAPMKVSVRLHNKETGEIKEQEIFMGDFPLMTQSGTFVINGAERVVVSQIVRSPGIYYGKEIDLKTDLPLMTSTVIPYRGAWLEYEILYCDWSSDVCSSDLRSAPLITKVPPLVIVGKSPMKISCSLISSDRKSVV